MSPRLALLATVLLGVRVCPAAPVPCTFSCRFDGTVSPEHAAGSAMALSLNEVFEPGHAGKGLAVREVDDAAYFMAGRNLPKDRGSVELWIRPLWPKGDRGRQGFVCEENSQAKPGVNTIWLWKYGTRLRFDVRDPEDRYITISVADWGPDEWHHVVATWDCDTGTALYVDGVLKGERECTWIPRSDLRFMVGKRRAKSEAAQAVIDELHIYARPLSAEEVRLALEGKLTRRFVRREAQEDVEQTTDREPELLFHLPFDGACNAALAKGKGTPVAEENVAYQPGVLGKAALFGRESRLKFERPGNLRKEAGTIAFWYKPSWRPEWSADAPEHERWRCCFVESPRPKIRGGSNMTWLWFWRDKLRFDVSNVQDTYATHGISGWATDRWHHIAATWDHTTGSRIFLDGEQVGVGRDGKSALLPTAWTVFDTFPFFRVGCGEKGQSAEGLIDDFRIYDGALTAEAVRAHYGAVFRLAVAFAKLGPPYVRTGLQASIGWQVRLRSPEPFKGQVQWRLLEPGGRVIEEAERVEVSFTDSSSVETFALEATPSVPGRHVLEVSWLAVGGRRTEELAFYAIAAEPTGPRPKEFKTRPIETIHLDRPLPPNRFAQVGESKVVQSPIGAYLEADAAQRSRFAVRVALPEADAAYVIEAEYPDDKPRTMEILAQPASGGSQSYELQTGVYCGDEYPLSNRLLTHRCVLWARSKDMAFLFMTAEEGRPAAVSSLRISKLVGRLPKNLAPTVSSTSGARRHMGIYYEDPALCYDFGGHQTMPQFEKTISRLMDYMEWSGQDLFMYPGVWYHGPLYPSRSQRVAMSRTHPDSFIDCILTRFEDRGLSFIPTLNVHNLSSLAKYKCTEELIYSNRMPSTPLMMYTDGMPNMGGWHGTPPNYNPLHPEARQAILAMVDEMVELYGDYRSFKGICFHLPRHVMLWFGHADAGYNDYCIDAFVKDTGVAIPVAPDDASRVRKRWKWLKANAWEQWIDWRCRAIRNLYVQVAQRLAAKRSDLKLIVNLYRPSIRDSWEDADYMTPGYTLRVNREGGIDPALFRDCPNVVIQQTIYPADYRWSRARNRGSQRERQRQRHFRAESSAALAAVPNVWINMHDRYWEDAVGRGESRVDAPWLKEVRWRVSTLNPTPPQFLQHYLAPLRFHDVQAFTKGGFLIGTHGVEAKLAEFSRVFRSLPAGRFSDVESRDETVKLRHRRVGNELYFYVANTAGKATDVTVKAVSPGGEVYSLNNRETVRLPRSGLLSIKLPPYSLAGYRVSGDRAAVEAVPAD